MAKKPILQISPDKGMRDMERTFKVGHPERYLRTMFEEKLIALVEQLKKQAKGSEIDFSQIKLVKIADGYALVFPQTKKAIEWADRDKVLVEFQTPHRFAKLGLLPPMILSPQLRKDPSLLIRTVSPAEQRLVLNRWAKNSAILVKEGFIQDGTPTQKRKQIFIEDQVALSEIIGTQNIAWMLLREEYGVQTRKIGAWKKSLPIFERMVREEMKNTIEKFQKQKHRGLIALPEVELGRSQQVKEFEEGIEGKVKPANIPPDVPVEIRRKNQALWVNWNQRVIGMLSRKSVRKKEKK